MFSLVLVGAMAVAADPAASRLAVIQDAPDFALTTQDGGTLKLADLKGRVCLVSFVFTTCNGTCPATTHRMGQVQAALKQRGLDKGDRVRLLSITLDPARDTPEVLRKYMSLYDAEPANWTFLTGDPKAIETFGARLGVFVARASNDPRDISHNLRTAIVGPDGKLIKVYTGNEWTPDEILADLKPTANAD